MMSAETRPRSTTAGAGGGAQGSGQWAAINIRSPWHLHVMGELAHRL